MNSEKSTHLLPLADHFSVLLSPTPHGARLARLLATDWMRGRDLPHRATEAAEHLVAELAATRPPTAGSPDATSASDGEPLLLAVEAQSGKNPDKPASWAYYASYMLNKYRLQPLLLVVCQDRATAEWAAREVSFGPRQWPLLTLRPLVAGPHNMPVITDPAAVRKDLALATLSAITHATHPDVGAILKSVTTVLRDTPQNIADPIIELVAQGLGKHPAAQQWRKLVAVDLSFYKSFISEEIRDEGRAQRAAEDVLAILEVRGISIPETVRERVTGCDDLEILRHWLRRAVTAPTAEEIFEDE
ncbi:hypothetical protein [Streptomyces flaveolus]|uniref:hypothetical protein n=1 Tax=Streptomyces flaveolus TaxID=67297 RepID=UPI0037013420